MPAGISVLEALNVLHPHTIEARTNPVRVFSFATRKEAQHMSAPTSIELSKQEFEGQTLRVAILDGEPWFASKDVGQALGRGASSLAYDIKSSLAEDESITLTRADLEGMGKTHAFLLPKNSITFISESGLYKVILRAHRKDSPELLRKAALYIENHAQQLAA